MRSNGLVIRTHVQLSMGGLFCRAPPSALVMYRAKVEGLVSSTGITIANMPTSLHRGDPGSKHCVKTNSSLCALKQTVSGNINTHGVHLSLYSLAMVSMPPLLATAM